jgi:hypothetical protein
LRRRRDGWPSPKRKADASAPSLFFVSVADKGVTARVSVSVASKGVVGGRFRLISAKTRNSAVSVADKGVGGAEVEELKAEELKNALGDTRVFLYRVPFEAQGKRKGLKNKKMDYALVHHRGGGARKSEPFAAPFETQGKQGKKE